MSKDLEVKTLLMDYIVLLKNELSKEDDEQMIKHIQSKIEKANNLIKG